MKYEEFKRRVKAEVKDYLPQEFKGAVLLEKKTKKINRTLTGLTIFPKEEDTCGPTIYYEELYEVYLKTGDFEWLLKQIAEGYVKSIAEIKDQDTALYNDCDCDSIKAGVFMNLINTEKNKKLLGSVPHKNILDLSIIYRCYVGMENGAEISYIITNEIVEVMGISMEELHCWAQKNMSEVKPLVIESTEEEFYIVTCKSRVLGAAYMINLDLLDKMAERLDADLYILPSSIHEVFIIRDTLGDPKELVNIIREANQTVVREDEILSYNLYHYERASKKLSIVQCGNPC